MELRVRAGGRVLAHPSKDPGLDLEWKRETQGGTEGGTDKETAGRCLVSVPGKMLLFKGLNLALGDLIDLIDVLFV